LQRQRIGLMPKPQNSATSTAADQSTDREADYKCLSPLRRKTSKLEGEDYYYIPNSAGSFPGIYVIHGKN
jgi:hypothetical protein